MMSDGQSSWHSLASVFFHIALVHSLCTWSTVLNIAWLAYAKQAECQDALVCCDQKQLHLQVNWPDCPSTVRQLPSLTSNTATKHLQAGQIQHLLLQQPAQLHLSKPSPRPNRSLPHQAMTMMPCLQVRVAQCLACPAPMGWTSHSVVSPLSDLPLCILPSDPFDLK